MTTNDIRTVVEQALELDKKRTQGAWRTDYSDIEKHPDCPLMIRSKIEGFDTHIADTYRRNRPHDADFIAASTKWPTAMAEMMQVIELCRESLVSAGRYMDVADPNVMTASKIRNALSAINKLSASAQGE